MAREDLRGLREAVRKLPKHHRAGVQYMGYSGLGRWIDWQARKHGVPALVVSALGT